MSAATMSSGSFAAVLAAESRSELLKTLRMPAFLAPVLLFPAMFYLLFGIVMSSRAPLPGLTMPAYLLATYGTFGVVGAALFGMGVGVAIERGQGWLTLKRATPMPPLAYFLAKVVMSMAIGAAVVLLLALLGAWLGGVRLSATVWTVLFATLVAGAIPFCALGCAIGFTAGPNSAPIIANLIYLPMSVASGLWIPLEFMPSLMQRIAVLLPPYHLARLALGAIDGSAGSASATTAANAASAASATTAANAASAAGAANVAGAGALVHVAALAGFTVLFLGIAVAAYRYGSERTWG